MAKGRWPWPGRKSSLTLGYVLLATGSLAGTRPKAHSSPEGREWLREAGWAVGVVGRGIHSDGEPLRPMRGRKGKAAGACEAFEASHCSGSVNSGPKGTVISTARMRCLRLHRTDAKTLQAGPPPPETAFPRCLLESVPQLATWARELS